MTAEASSAHGAKVEIGDGASAEVFTEIKLITSGPDGGGIEPKIITATVHSQKGDLKRATGVTYNPFTFTVLYDSSNTEHAALRDAATLNTLKNFKITKKDKGEEVVTFAAYVGVDFADNPDGWSEMSVTLEPEDGATFS